MSSSVLIRWFRPVAVLAGVLLVVTGLLTETNPQLSFLNATSSRRSPRTAANSTYFDKAVTLAGGKRSK
jgi:carbohydrate-binding DOMON domain-containing protein